MSTSGCAAMASPTTGPVPVTRLNTPAGRPISSMISARMNALSGATSLGLSTTVQPAARAGRDLGDDLVERVVPRRDAADHADRLLDDERVADLLLERELVEDADVACRRRPAGRPAWISCERNIGMPTSPQIVSAISWLRAPRPSARPWTNLRPLGRRRSATRPRRRPWPRRRRGRRRRRCPRGCGPSPLRCVALITSIVPEPVGRHPLAVDVELVVVLHVEPPRARPIGVDR